MASTLTWLDHAETERRRMLDIIGLFRDQGTVGAVVQPTNFVPLNSSHRYT